MSNKFRNLLVVFISLLSLFPLICGILLAEFLPIDGAVLLIVLSVIIFILGLSVAICIDYNLCVYKCRNCGHEFKPTLKAYLWSVHTVTSRYLKCPDCGKKSFCKSKCGRSEMI